MNSMRKMVIPFAYDQLEYLTDLIDREGEDANIAGYPASADDSGFTDGAIIHASVLMYVNARENDDPRLESYKARMLRFFDRITEDSILETWGKLSTLESLRLLADNHILSTLPESKLSLLKRKTDYTDFLDKETLTFKKRLPTNYYHVAMECAGQREILGFEDEGMSDHLADKMFSIMQSYGESGWMDEQPPHGRFDSYSVGMNLTMCSALTKIGKPVPDFLKVNLQKTIDLYYAKRNRDGNGFAYGRSLSIYGDKGVAGHLAYALANNLLKETQINEAVMYCLHIVEKQLNFWFRKDLRSCDIWLDGRATEGYRGIHKIFSVNMDFCVSLLGLLKQFEKAGLADYVPSKDLEEPKTWEWHKTTFIENETSARAMYVLRRGKHSFMLPLIGLGSRFGNASYMPFAAEPRFTEAPPAGIRMPFLVPEVILQNGDITMPIEFYESITETAEEDMLTITAKGRLCKMNLGEPFMSDYGFTTVYTFKGDMMKAEFSFENAAVSYILYAGQETKHVKFTNVLTQKLLDVSGNPDYHAPHGALTKCIVAVGCDNRIGYEITLNS